MSLVQFSIMWLIIGLYFDFLSVDSTEGEVMEVSLNDEAAAR